MKKKLLSVLLVVFTSFLLVACSGKAKTDEAVKAAHDRLVVQDKAGVNFTVPANDGDVSITWESKNTAILTVGTTAEGKTTIVVTNPEANTDVKLVATLTLKKSKQTKAFTVNVLILDETAPVFKGLPKDGEIHVDYGSLSYDWLEGVSASDNVDGNLKKSDIVVDDKAVKFNEIGQYPIYYTVKDSAGNEAKETVTVVVGDYSAPVITGFKLHTLLVGETAPDWEEGVVGNDKLDGKVDVTVDTTDVNLNEAGEYYLVYRSVDKAGNRAAIRIRVTVRTTAEAALASLELPERTAVNVTLPTTVNGVTVSWATSKPEVITNAGVVTRGNGNKAAKLIATAVDKGVTLTREFWVTVRDVKADLDASYNSAYGEIQTLNPLNSTNNADSDVFDNLTDNLFSGDYDWELAMAEGHADYPGDFSKIKSDRNPTGTVDMPSIAYKQTLRMAAKYPYAVNKGTNNEVPGSFGQLLDQDKAKNTLDDRWLVTLRDDLVFEDDTEIDTATVEYSFKQYLDPKQNNERANFLYNEDYIPLVNGHNYFKGLGTWDDVGFEVLDKYTFEIRTTKEMTQYDLMSYLSMVNLVHVESYEKGFNATKTENNYGSVTNPLISYGEYTLNNNYEDTKRFEFTRNEKHFAAWDVPFKHIGGPILSDQNAIINEFKSGKLDVAGVGGEFWNEFKDNDDLYVSPSNSFYRLAISIERPEGRGKPIMKSADFRRALYLATDRSEFADTIQPPSEGALGFLSNIHQVSQWASQAYSSSIIARRQLEALGLSPETGGFNSQEAKDLFDKARAEAIAAGEYKENEVIKIDYLYYDAGSNTRIANWVKATYERVFNEGHGANKVFEVNLNAVSSDELSAQRAAGDFDLVFTGMSGATFQATFGMGFIFSPTYSTFLVGKGHNVSTLPVTAEIKNLLDLLTEKDEFDEEKVSDGVVPEGMRTKAEQAFFAKMDPTDGVFTGTFDELFNLYSTTPTLDVDYEGQEEDLTNITAALEGALLKQMIGVPLFSATSAAVYSNKVVRTAHAYHLFLGWGGTTYMYKTK